LRFGDCDISEDNAKISAPHETANLTCENANLTHVKAIARSPTYWISSKRSDPYIEAFNTLLGLKIVF